ncbi:hypothetical protein IFM89_013857 [Coptis chinensis]|uniref:F-box/FBD/LRR-repeat protein n=1 Tax=Coptis chinensis TaxID=261450 RepID=A0A835MIB2_9MAGN|nr:hypothetical protein IFM89_013857 [Coptis chinensis]
METGSDRAPDIISNLPLNVIEGILMCLPLRDAVRTSILSRKWRYRWTTIPQLVFDDTCVPVTSSSLAVTKTKFVSFVDRALLLHRGPIQKFKLSISYLQSCPDIDQWILFLSWRNVKEISLELEEKEWYKVPSCLFSCQYLTHLELFRCEVHPPPTFKGFSNLKSLSFQQSYFENGVVESILSSCPILESFTLTPPRGYYLTCNLIKALGNVPALERLVAESYFVKYLSVKSVPSKLALKYEHLKKLELYQVGFEDVNEISVAICLLVCSPNLEELLFSASSDNEACIGPDMDYWDKQHPIDCSFKRLQIVNMTDMSGVPDEMEFTKFLLAKSPVLKTMSIKSSTI